MNLRTIAQRLAGTPPAPQQNAAAILMPPSPPAQPGVVARAAHAVAQVLTRDWRRTLTDLDAKLAEARARRDALVMERDGLILTAIEGDDAARQRADGLDGQIEAIERQIERLGIARRKAAEQVAIDDATEARKREKDRLDAITAAAARWRETARKVDAAAAQLAADLGEFRDAALDLRQKIDREQADWMFKRLGEAVPLVVCHALSESNYPFGRMAFSDKRTLLEQVPEDDTILADAQRPKGR